jgi:hypothetical protein
MSAHNSSWSVMGGVLTFPELHPTFRAFRLSAGSSRQILGPGSLPKLTKMTASAVLGQFLIASPTLTEFYQHPNDYSRSVGELWSWLAHAQGFQPLPLRLEQLRVAILCHSDSLGALPVISHFFGKSLRKLHIWVEGGSFSWRSGYAYLLGGWRASIGPGLHSGNQATIELPHLCSIQVSFPLIRGERIPEWLCKELLKANILPLCPVLEEALFTAISSYKSIELEEPGDGMELRFRKKGRTWDPPLQN